MVTLRLSSLGRWTLSALLFCISIHAADAKKPAKPTNAPPVIQTKAPRYVAKPKKPEKKTDAKAETKKPEKFDDEKPFDEIVKNMDVIKGFLTFYKKADENKIYLEIATNQFDKLFLFSGSIDQSVGERGLYAAQMAGEFPFMFRLVGKNVQMLMKNSSFTATNNTPESRFTERSFPDA